MDAEDPDQPAEFDAEPILAVLERHGVEYVIVGGYAARMHGATRPTRDVDVTPATSRENLDHLAAALRELDARIRTDAVSEGLPFSSSGESLVGQRMLNLQTRYGELDLTIRPAAFEGGYDELVRRAIRRTIGQVQVRIAALEDVIRSKLRRPPRATRTFAHCPSCTAWRIWTGDRRRPEGNPKRPADRRPRVSPQLTALQPPGPPADRPTRARAAEWPISGRVRILDAPVTMFHEGAVFTTGSIEQLRRDERVLDVYLGRDAGIADVAR